MTMPVEVLQIIELDAATASAPMVDQYIQLVRSSAVNSTPEATASAPKPPIRSRPRPTWLPG